MATAFIWYRKAAEQGYADAQILLAIGYIDGAGLAKNAAVGAEWIRKAAEQGHARAQYGLGACYLEGTGVPKDEVLGYMWTMLAADQWDERAIKDKSTLDRSLSPKQIAEGERLAKEWKAAQVKK